MLKITVVGLLEIFKVMLLVNNVVSWQCCKLAMLLARLSTLRRQKTTIMRIPEHTESPMM